MSAKIAGGCLLAVLALTSGARAQSSHEHTSESAQPSPQPAAGSAKAPDLGRVEQRILGRTNQFRRQEGRGLLRWNAKLAQTARGFAEFMARTGKFGHTADGKQPWDRTAAHGYDGCIIAENIAWESSSAGFTTRGLADALMKGWEKSPHHRKNLLDPDLDEIGVGVAYSKESGRYYAVQDFGRPKSEALVFTVANDVDTAVRFTVDGKDLTVEPHYTMTVQRCRPPALTFHLGSAAGKEEVYHPHRGSHYVIRNDNAGRPTIVDE